MEQKDPAAEIDSLQSEIKRLRKVLHRLTPPLQVMLKRRGFEIYRKEPSDDLFIPGNSYIDNYYEMLKRYSFRLFLRDVIKHQPLFRPSQVTRYATREVTDKYIAYLVRTGLIVAVADAYRIERSPIKSFGETLEWFVAEVFKREFFADVIWGVKVKKRTTGGDYDLLAKIDGSILYMEIKSSPPKQIYQKEITAFFERVCDLHPGVAVFFVDTELRMKDKIVPMFEDELRAGFPEPPEVRRIEKELFAFSSCSGNGPLVFIINAKDSIIGNIKRVLAEYFRRII